MGHIKSSSEKLARYRFIEFRVSPVVSLVLPDHTVLWVLSLPCKNPPTPTPPLWQVPSPAGALGTEELPLQVHKSHWDSPGNEPQDARGPQEPQTQDRGRLH